MAGKVRHAGRGWEVVAVAEGQHGVISRGQIRGLGLSERTIERWVADGRLHCVHGEVFAVGRPAVTEMGRRWAAVLAYGPGTVLSHRSAATLWGLTQQRSKIVDVTATRGRQGVRRRNGIFIHRGRLDLEERTVRSGIPTTTVARTLFDMAEFVSLDRLESAWEEADRLSLLELKAVERVCERGHGRKALKPIRRLLIEARAPEITRSVLEDRFAAFCREHRLSTPSFNTTVFGYEVDALWPEQRVAGELDSWEFHRHRAAFERDRARDSALQAAGYRTIRVTDRRLKHDPSRLLAQLRALLRLGSNQPGVGP